MKEKGRGVAEQQHSKHALAPASRVVSVVKAELPRTSRPTASSCSSIGPLSENIALLQFQTDDVVPRRASDVH
jgi:hypothetical protein